jgi:nicotinate dehydrogenase subunit B
MGIDVLEVDVVRMEAAGCYGRNGADDVSADAALLARAVGAPVRVQLTREQENAWDPKGAAQWMQVRGGLGTDGKPVGYDFQTSYPSNGAPTLALLLTRTIEPTARAYEMGDRTARPPYQYPALRVTVNDMAPILRASWLRGVSALPNSFAHESFIDELATAANVDPVQYRLELLEDPRARELIEATAKRANWKPHDEPRLRGTEDGWLQGQGFAYARYIHSRWPGFGAAWAAWVADVEVHPKTGEVHVKRVVVGHDAGQLINPAGVTHQVHGNVIQTTSRALLERVETDLERGTVVAPDWGSYPILSFREVPVIEVLHMPRPGEAPLGAGESSSVPGTAAIANAIFDATGVRFRQPPFTPEVIRAALNPLPPPRSETDPGSSDPHPPNPIVSGPVQSGLVHSQPSRAPGIRADWRSRMGRLGGVALGMLTATVALIGWRPSLEPLQRVDLSGYSAAALSRGQTLAALGHCSGCHTSEDGPINAGGRPLETPFGVVYSTNLTPDAQSGIGRWSYRTFERAMREGISREGHHLYPAFPYTAFAGMRDEDMMALYGWLMSQPAVNSPIIETQLRFPFNVRPLMALWNGVFHRAVPWNDDPERNALWNRGAYLVNHVGNCGGCHTPRNPLGAEQQTEHYLRGALNDGWEAPALDALSRAPIAWTEDEFYQYLRQGHSRQHGAAAGPMASVVRAMGPAPDADIRSIAHYLASLQGGERPVKGQVKDLIALAAEGAPLPGRAQRQFEGSCGGCHYDGSSNHLLGQNLPLALNTNLYSDRPDNLIRIILDGIQAPASVDSGFMPGFREIMTDRQLTELIQWMRQRFAPGQHPWENLAQSVARVRVESAN